MILTTRERPGRVDVVISGTVQPIDEPQVTAAVERALALAPEVAVDITGAARRASAEALVDSCLAELSESARARVVVVRR